MHSAVDLQLEFSYDHAKNMAFGKTLVIIPSTKPIIVPVDENANLVLSFYQKGTGGTIILEPIDWFEEQSVSQALFNGVLPGDIGSIQIYEQNHRTFILKKVSSSQVLGMTFGNEYSTKALGDSFINPIRNSNNNRTRLQSSNSQFQWLQEIIPFICVAGVFALTAKFVRRRLAERRRRRKLKKYMYKN